MRRGFLGLLPAECGLSAPLSGDIELLGRLLGQMLEKQEGEGLPALARPEWEAAMEQMAERSRQACRALVYD